MHDPRWLAEHRRLSRRYFLQAGVAASAVATATLATAGRTLATDETKPTAKPVATPTGTKPAAEAAKPKKTDKAGAFGIVVNRPAGGAPLRVAPRA